jgi:PDZ domain
MMSEYVTVVSVDLQPNGGTINNVINEHEKKSSFVTVLSINNNQNTTTISTSLENSLNGEIVTVYRLPGERLGFGLKFQGGTKTNEKVERLFIQSCDPESPASKARASWGALGEGDEILQIDGEPVTNMTRIDCVKCLKDRNVAINLLVRKGDSNSLKMIKNDSLSNGTKRPLLPPPPPKVPPRKIVRKPPTIVPPHPKIVMETPVAAEMYLNCTLDDDLTHNDESDETGSTISSQISVISNFSSESDLSLLSTNASNSDLTRILTKPFQMIEREFNVKNSSVANTAKTPMSIDNLLLFNQSEHGDFNSISNISSSTNNNNNINNNNNSSDDIKAMMSNYVNVQATTHDDHERLMYENIDIDVKVPVPRPRSISSLPKEAHCEIDTKTPTKTIESWLNDAKALNSDKNAPSDSDQSYEPIKFECFAAGDDEEEKLGPPELLSISEAYFNFPWCTNTSNCLPTIGEAEEEFSSIEPAQQQQFSQQKVLINR